MKLRLYHHPDGARVAYRETGTGPPLGLLHSIGLSYREWEPVVDALAHRFRLILPDLPLHGASEDGPDYPYTPAWLTDVIAGFCRETLGAHPLVGGHDIGAELLVRAVAEGKLAPRRLVLMSSRLHAAPTHPARLRVWRAVTGAAALPGLDRLLARGVPMAFRPALGERLSARADPAGRDLVRHALADVPGNVPRARSWARFARAWPLRAGDETLAAYAKLAIPTLLLWADQDRLHPLKTANEALDALPNGQLRVLSDTGFLMAYDDPVGVARELAAFCG
ncbi:MAG TPA: alpha/beta hydrolase [Solirubrobacteraceae bacterium]|nr:alpha/beta hydrolase [Solirubrobacteraceae bacterium]